MKRNKRKKVSTLTVYTARERNKTNPNIHNSSVAEKNFWKEIIFTSQHVKRVNDASTSKSLSILKDHSPRDILIQQIVAENIGQHVNIMQYDEKSSSYNQLSLDQILKYVKKKFDKKISEYKRLLKREMNNNDSSEIKQSKKSPQKKDQINIKSTTNGPKKEDLEVTKLKSIPNIELLLGSKNLFDEALHPKWMYHSMIHSLFESFEFVLYDGSHKIPEGLLTHHHTRVVLKFPAEINMFILFHGNLVHNGAKAKFESSNYSMNYASALRAFAYVNKFKKYGRTEQKKDGITPRYTHIETLSLRVPSYKGCLKMLSEDGTINLTSVCDECQKHVNSNKHMTSNGIEIDLKKAYMEYLDNKKSPSGSTTPIIGDIDTHGWAVYCGLNTKDIKNVGSLFDDCRDVIYNKVKNIDWKQSKKKPPKGSGRYGFKIGEGYFFSDYNKKDKLKSIVDFYQKWMKEYVHKIDGFTNAIISEGHLLRNVGPLSEQAPHRDFEAM